MLLDKPNGLIGKTAAPVFRVDVVDDDHEHWPGVLEQITRTGNQDSLLLGETGLLSARQNVLAAFSGNDVVGHVAFHVRPAECPEGRIVVQEGRALVEARLNSLGVTPGLNDAKLKSLRALLVKVARARAEQLAHRLVGFDPAY